MIASRTRRPFKRRGSALIFVSVMLVAITSIVVASTQLNFAAAEKSSRVISDAKAQATFEAQVALVNAANKTNSFTVPYSGNFTLNGYTINVDIRDNSSVMDRTLLISAGGTLNDKQYTFTRVVGARQTSYPLYYAIFSDGLLDATGYSLYTLNGGPIYSRGAITINPSCSIDGDVIAGETVTDTGAANVRNKVSFGPSLRAPSFNASDYQSAGTALSNLLPLATVSFSSALLGQPYPMYYCDGNTSLAGPILGKGTLFVKGNLTITGDMTPVLGAQLLIIVDGTITINSTVNNICGWLYAGKDIISTGGGLLTVNGGSICTMKRYRIARSVAVYSDRSMWSNRNEAIRFHAPGFWPTADPNLTR